jgi:hypothetical protein
VGAVPLGAETTESSTSFFVGLGPEINANSREGIAASFNLSLGLDFSRSFGAGLMTGLSDDFDKLSTLEFRAFFRYYIAAEVSFLSGFAASKQPGIHALACTETSCFAGNTGPFVQAEFGTSIFFEKNATTPAFLSGLTLGWRFPINANTYIEPALRGGYPTLWGIGVSIGGAF